MKKILLTMYATTLCLLFSVNAAEAQSSEALAAQIAAKTVRQDTLNHELQVIHSIQDAINHTLTISPDLEGMRYNRDTLQYETRRAYGGYFPRVDVTAGAGGGWKQDLTPDSPTTSRGFTDRYQGGASISQMLFDGWKTSSDVGRSQATLDSSRNRYMDNAEVLSLDAAIAYMEVLRNRRLVELSVKNVENHKFILESLHQRRDLGAGSEADVVQTQARLARSEASLEEARSTADISEANFLRAIGAVPGQDIDFPAHPQDLVPPGLEAFLLATLENNPKVKSGLKDIEAAEFAVTNARAAFFPTLYVAASANTDQWERRDYQTNDYGVMLTMRWNLFAGCSDFNAVSAAMSRVQESQSALRSLEYTLRKEAQAAWREYEAAVRMVQHMTATVDYNLQTKEFYWDQFQIGQRSLLDGLDAENEYFQSSSQLVTWRVNEYIAIYRLASLRGALLSGLGIDSRLFDIDQLQVTAHDIPWVR
jgi:adhesin transport system outer membrane protein